MDTAMIGSMDTVKFRALDTFFGKGYRNSILSIC